MPKYLSCKQIADALDVPVTKTSQATAHLFRKMAALRAKYPVETDLELAEETRLLWLAQERKRKAEDEQRQQEFEAVLPQLEAMHNGNRLDRLQMAGSR